MNEPQPVLQRDRFSLLEFSVVAFTVWTIGFWIALALSRGWVLSAVLAFGLGAALWFWLGRPVPWERIAATERPDATWRDLLGSPLGIASAVALVVVTQQGSTTSIVSILTIVAGFAAALWFEHPSSPFGTQPQILAVAAVAAAVIVGLYVSTWIGFIVAITIAALAALALTLRDGSYDEPNDHRPLTEMSAITAGLVMATWTAMVPQPNPDDTYYLNKAAHYAQSPWRFEFIDQLYGVDGVRHLSTTDYWSSYEPLVGLASALSDTTASMLRAVIFAPLAAFAIPVAMRYLARTLRLPRPDLVAIVTVLLLSLYRLNGDSILFIDKIAQGKGIAALVVVPIVIGSAVLADRSPTKHRMIVVFSAVITLFALSGSAAIAGMGALGACVITFVICERRLSRGAAWAIGGAALLAVFGLFGYLIEPNTGVSAGPVSELFSDAESSWIRRAFVWGRDVHLDLAPIHVLVIGGLVVALFIATNRFARILLVMLTLITFTVLYDPIVFSPIIDGTLHLGWLSWRFGWMLPTGLGLGIAIDAASKRFGWLGVAAATAALALVWFAGTPHRLGWQRPSHDLGPKWVAVAEEIMAVTPPGGRYLGPEDAEHAVAVLEPDIYPTFARRIYVAEVPKLGEPADFHYDEREGLRRWIGGSDRAYGDPAQQLETLEIDTVCVPKALYETEFGDAVRANYTLDKELQACDVWVR